MVTAATERRHVAQPTSSLCLKAQVVPNGHLLVVLNLQRTVLYFFPAFCFKERPAQ